MTKLLSKNLLSPILVGFVVWIAAASPTRANPNPEITPPNTTASPIVKDSLTANEEQLNQTKTATEIKPGDWAYQTLQALNSRYGCGDAPMGNRSLSREEFATSLNGCVESIEQLIARKPRRGIKKRRVTSAPEIVAPSRVPEVVSPRVTPEIIPPAPAEPEVSQQDLDRLKQLVQSFNTELQSIDGRIQALDSKLADLKAQSFSTTTKLNGEVIFGVSGYGGVTEKAAVPAVPATTNLVTGVVTPGKDAVPARLATGNILSDRIRLNFDTSFTGKDRLRTRLQSRNTAAFNSSVTGTNMTRLGYDGDEGNSTSVSLLQYSFPISPDTKIIAETVGSEFNENMYTFNPILASSGEGSISRFGRFNPIYRLSGDGAALTVNHKFSNELGLAVGYAVPGNSASNPANGIFNGSNAIISQLSFRPSEDLNLGLVYARSYSADGNNISGGTGSSAANRPFGSSSASVPTSANHYSFLASYKLSPSFILSGWAGLIDANRETTDSAHASISNYSVSLAFPDFGQKGNNLAFSVGIPPKLNTRSGTGVAATTGNPDTSYHLEALYKMKLSDNIAITPGLLLITSPEHNSANATEYVGTIRTTFKF